MHMSLQASKNRIGWIITPAHLQSKHGFEIQSSGAFRGSSPCPVSSLPTPGSYGCGGIPEGCVVAETKCECGRKKSNPSYTSHSV